MNNAKSYWKRYKHTKNGIVRFERLDKCVFTIHGRGVFYEWPTAVIHRECSWVFCFLFLSLVFFSRKITTGSQRIWRNRHLFHCVPNRNHEQIQHNKFKRCMNMLIHAAIFFLNYRNFSVWNVMCLPCVCVTRAPCSQFGWRFFSRSHFFLCSIQWRNQNVNLSSAVCIHDHCVGFFLPL